MNIFYCIEDDLSRAVAERLMRDFCPPGVGIHELGKAYGGYGYIRKNLSKFENLAQRAPVFIVTDLDRAECAPSLRRDWFASANISEPPPNKMLFCVAQTEIESWLLADTDGISKFLQISPAKLVANIESVVVDSKEYLVQLAKSSPNADIRNAIVPINKSKAATGLNYNFKLTQFVHRYWDPLAAAQNSASLQRAVNKLSSVVL